MPHRCTNHLCNTVDARRIRAQSYLDVGKFRWWFVYPIHQHESSTISVLCGQHNGQPSTPHLSNQKQNQNNVECEKDVSCTSIFKLVSQYRLLRAMSEPPQTYTLNKRPLSTRRSSSKATIHGNSPIRRIESQRTLAAKKTNNPHKQSVSNYQIAIRCPCHR